MRKGFTLVELLLVMGILAVLFSIMTVRYFGVQGKNVLAQGVGLLVADMKSQQTKAMAGFIPSGGSIQAGYGIHFGTDSYTLFMGDSYSAVSPDNAVVNLPVGVVITDSNMPGGSLVFLRASGELKDYVNGSEYYVDMTSTANSETRRVRVNELGVVTEGM